jgi:hypothetical protein
MSALVDEIETFRQELPVEAETTPKSQPLAEKAIT